LRAGSNDKAHHRAQKPVEVAGGTLLNRGFWKPSCKNRFSSSLENQDGGSPSEEAAFEQKEKVQARLKSIDATKGDSPCVLSSFLN